MAAAMERVDQWVALVGFSSSHSGGQRRALCLQPAARHGQPDPIEPKTHGLKGQRE